MRSAQNLWFGHFSCFEIPHNFLLGVMTKAVIVLSQRIICGLMDLPGSNGSLADAANEFNTVMSSLQVYYKMHACSETPFEWLATYRVITAFSELSNTDSKSIDMTILRSSGNQLRLLRRARFPASVVDSVCAFRG
jgi:hypothetical protein